MAGVVYHVPMVHGGLQILLSRKPEKSTSCRRQENKKTPPHGPTMVDIRHETMFKRNPRRGPATGRQREHCGANLEGSHHGRRPPNVVAGVVVNPYTLLVQGRFMFFWARIWARSMSLAISRLPTISTEIRIIEQNCKGQTHHLR